MIAPDRRRHIAYITGNTEYHCRDRECVGVKDRNTGTWQIRHPALRAKLAGGLNRLGLKVKENPDVGLRLLFCGKRTVMTSRVLSTERPPRDSTFYYTSMCRSGEIQ